MVLSIRETFLFGDLIIITYRFRALLRTHFVYDRPLFHIESDDKRDMVLYELCVRRWRPANCLLLFVNVIIRESRDANRYYA